MDPTRSTFGTRRRLRSVLRLGLWLLVTTAFGRCALAVPSAACAASGWPACPNTVPGKVDVGLFDNPVGRPMGGEDPNLFGLPGGFEYDHRNLDEDELQCAIDCLDADPDDDHTPTWDAGTGQWSIPTVDGGVIEFRPSLNSRIRAPLFLPLSSLAPIILRGNGAFIEVRPNHLTPSLTCQPAITRLPPRAVPPGAPSPDISTAGDLIAMGRAAKGWIIEDLTFELGRLAAVPLDPDPATMTYKGIELYGTEDLTIRRCRFQGQAGANFATAIEIRASVNPNVESCEFIFSVDRDIAIEPPFACGGGGGCEDRCVDPSRSSPAYFAPVPAPPFEHGTRIARSHHFAIGPSVKSLVIDDQAPALIVDASFDCCCPTHFVDRSGDASADTTIRDLRAENYDCDDRFGFLMNRSAGDMAIDGITGFPMNRWHFFYDGLAADPGAHFSMTTAWPGSYCALRFRVHGETPAFFLGYEDMNRAPDDEQFWLGLCVAPSWPCSGEVPVGLSVVNALRLSLPGGPSPGPGAGLGRAPGAVWRFADARGDQIALTIDAAGTVSSLVRSTTGRPCTPGLPPPDCEKEGPPREWKPPPLPERP
jgi:hypothetical protein